MPKGQLVFLKYKVIKHHSHLDIVTTPPLFHYRGSTCIRETLFQNIDKTYKACKSIWISIKHPGVTVAFLISTAEGAGSIPEGANFFLKLPPNIIQCADWIVS